MTEAEKYGLLLSLAELLVGGTGLGLVFGQLREMKNSLRVGVEANKTSNLMAVLALEEGLARSRAELSDAAREAALIADEESEAADETTGLKLAKLRYDEKKEQYLNAADRLCACIIRGYVDEETYRQDYRPAIAEIVSQHRDRLGPDTRHRNILKVNDAWAQDKSAREK